MQKAESELLKLSDVQLSLKKLEDEMSAWKRTIRDIPGVLGIDDIPLKFAALQKEVVESMVKVGEANAYAKQLEVAKDAAELSKQNAETETALAKENAKLSKSEVKQIELMLSSVTEERDRLKNAVSELRNDNKVEEEALQNELQKTKEKLEAGDGSNIGTSIGLSCPSME